MCIPFARSSPLGEHGLPFPRFSSHRTQNRLTGEAASEPKLERPSAPSGYASDYTIVPAHDSGMHEIALNLILGSIYRPKTRSSSEPVGLRGEIPPTPRSSPAKPARSGRHRDRMGPRVPGWASHPPPRPADRQFHRSAGATNHSPFGCRVLAGRRRIGPFRRCPADHHHADEQAGEPRRLGGSIRTPDGGHFGCSHGVDLDLRSRRVLIGGTGRRGTAK